MNELNQNNLIKLLFSDGYRSDPHLKVYMLSENVLRITYGQMYESPTLNVKTLLELSKLFGTTDINVDDYSFVGCESCDWGSDYGHDIDIKDFTVCVSDVVGINWKKD